MDRGEKILKLLNQRGWSKSQLAERAGLKPRNVSYVISGSREPGVSSAIAIARVLGVTADWLFDEDRDWPPPEKPTPTQISDLEIIRQLCKRLKTNQLDVQMARSALDEERLRRLDYLAEQPNRKAIDQQELEDGIRDILLYQNALQKAEALEGFVLSLLRPDQTIEYTSLGSDRWLKDIARCPHLEKAMEDLDQRKGHYFLGMRGRKDAPESSP